ncbi:hypothetical protein CPT_Mater234 [Bacillus phage Mater]|uniref:Uncharacterized protein n=1 Tax=Bacillus phage Mater TaxID=1540090 RepID=A0A0A0RNF1_9CAUD|nr:hypothetical protein CPT_Mater12 [Bacillus phage Mater]YP_009151193.1 hypothetical protein CPT_Mater234 [Bacillus phage Mater]AIW03169.1 hypothetical protein CPT_Mater12 [Bacillus phage Mater]AIW03391.1 hypothetical protein CPT_Mater234 [Bacillus phage Mater]
MGLRNVCTVCDGDAMLDREVTCSACNNSGWQPVEDNKIVYVNVYLVERCYGGPEEGGWYYNHYECIEVFPVRNIAADTMLSVLEDEHAHKSWGNIYSVLGGEEVHVMIEAEPKQSETKEKPIYE